MKPLLDLELNDCRWPVSSGRPHMFCGEPKLTGCSYCACHKAMSLRAPQPARDQRTLDRMADFLDGRPLRKSDYRGEGRGREAVDTAIKASLGNATRLRRGARPPILFETRARVAAWRAAE